MTDIKNKLLRPATTSHFECSFNPPRNVYNFMESRARAGAGVNLNAELMDRINISCHDASLPGSSLNTATLTDSYPGITENYAYRRAFDNRADFTFYVDYLEPGKQNSQSYTVILFFENWISYIANEKYSSPNQQDRRPSFDSTNYFCRVNFPENYIAPKISIKKFEKERLGRFLQYDFINSFPISMTSMPVSYESSQLLKCTVSFSYQRYLIKTTPYPGLTAPPAPSLPPPQTTPPPPAPSTGTPQPPPPQPGQSTGPIELQQQPFSSRVDPLF